jgi:hypothetical protein
LKKYIASALLALIAPALTHAQEAETDSVAAVSYPPEMASNTLPIVYINTVDTVPILDKVTPIDATMYVDSQFDDDFDDLASEDDPAILTIRGRGNASWNWPKKPYKLKFKKRTSLLGLPANKHFSLLALNQGYTDWHAYMAGLQLGEIIGFDWTPHMVPVELVLNNSYEGLYFLVENVKVDENRLNIFEQPDECEDPELIPYGWLVEFDNYAEENQIILQETPSQRLRITYKSPEVLSDMQREWLTNEFNTIDSLLYQNDKTNEEWLDYVDLTSFVKYFIVSEVLHNTDAYNGSFYLHKDLDSKWTAAPLWDMMVEAKSNYVLYEHYSYQRVHWMGEMAKYASFTEEFNRLWDDFYPDKLEAIYGYLDEVTRKCTEAYEANRQRWPEISSKSGADSKGTYVKNHIRNNAAWIDQHRDITAQDPDAHDGINELLQTAGSKVSFVRGMLHFDDPSAVSELALVGIDGRKIQLQPATYVALSGIHSGLYIVVVNGHAALKIAL